MLPGDWGMDFVCVPLARTWQMFKSWLGLLFFRASVTTAFLWNRGNIANSTPFEQWSSRGPIDSVSCSRAFVSCLKMLSEGLCSVSQSSYLKAQNPVKSSYLSDWRHAEGYAPTVLCMLTMFLTCLFKHYRMKCVRSSTCSLCRCVR